MNGCEIRLIWNPLMLGDPLEGQGKGFQGGRKSSNRIDREDDKRQSMDMSFVEARAISGSILEHVLVTYALYLDPIIAHQCHFLSCLTLLDLIQCLPNSLPPNVLISIGFRPLDFFMVHFLQLAILNLLA